MFLVTVDSNKRQIRAAFQDCKLFVPKLQLLLIFYTLLLFKGLERGAGIGLKQTTHPKQCICYTKIWILHLDTTSVTEKKNTQPRSKKQILLQWLECDLKHTDCSKMCLWKLCSCLFLRTIHNYSENQKLLKNIFHFYFTVFIYINSNYSISFQISFILKFLLNFQKKCCMNF